MDYVQEFKIFFPFEKSRILKIIFLPFSSCDALKIKEHFCGFGDAEILCKDRWERIQHVPQLNEIIKSLWAVMMIGASKVTLNDDASDES